MAKQVTIRGVSKELARRLERLAASRDQSVNATVLEVLERATGIDARKERLMRYATCSPEEQRELAGAIAAQRTIDSDGWR